METMARTITEQGNENLEFQKSMTASMATMTEVQEQQRREVKSEMDTLARLEEKIDGIQCFN